MTDNLLPVDTLVRVTPRPVQLLDGTIEPARPPYTAIVRGYDMGRTKYHLSPELYAGTGQFISVGLRWEFPQDVALVCPHCHGTQTDPEDPGDWVPEVGMHNPSTVAPCPACNGTGLAAACPTCGGDGIHQIGCTT